MKFRIIAMAVLILILGTNSGVMAQSSFKAGLKAGISVSSLDLESVYVELDNRIGYWGGAFLVLDAPGMVDLQAEVLYVQKGATSDFTLVDENGQSLGEYPATYGIDYLEIPVLAKISLGTNPLYVLAGASYAYKLSSKLSASDLPTADREEEWEGISDSDFSLIVGLGLAVPTGLGEVLVDARYTMGLVNVLEEENEMDEPLDVKNKSVLISVGISF